MSFSALFFTELAVLLVWLAPNRFISFYHESCGLLNLIFFTLQRPLKSIPIQEIQLGKTTPEKPPTRLKIIEIDDQTHGDSNNNDSNKIDDTPKNMKGEGDVASPESVKLVTDGAVKEKDVKTLVPPTNSVQFMSEWKYLKGQWEARCEYLSVSINISCLCLARIRFYLL